MIRIALLLLFLLAAVQDTRAQSLRYETEANGASALVPGSWRRASGHPVWGGSRFLSPDRQSAMAIWSSPANEGDTHSYMQSIARSGKVSVTYSKTGSGWFVLSGYRRNHIFYVKAIRACGRFHHVYLEYPRSEKRAYDRTVTAISRSLRAGC